MTATVTELHANLSASDLEEKPVRVSPDWTGDKTTLTLTLPDIKVHLHGSSRSNMNPLTSLFFLRVGDCDVTEFSTECRLELRGSKFAPSLPGWLVIVLTLLAGPSVYLLRRLRKSQEAVLQLEEAHLILPDGSLPKRIGSYRPTGILGSGAMGVVYKAVSQDGIPCAIKVPLPNLVADREFRDRFQREIKLCLELRHPNLAQLLELPEGDYPYMVMEWIQAPPMENIERLPLQAEIRRCRSWAEQVLGALAYIHEMGIIHRDLKPSNLMVEVSGRVVIMDFGIAHSVHGTKLTATGSALGTPLYMSPEQLIGDELDGRADLFSVGLLLYERILGQLPYSEDITQLLGQKMGSSLAPLHEQNSEVPMGVSNFVAKLAANDRYARFRNAEEARSALQEMWSE